MTATPDTGVQKIGAQKIGEPMSQEEAIASMGRYGYGWSDSDVAGASAKRGLSEDVVRDISAKKNEPEWMLQTRLKALRIFDRKPMPNWGSNLDGIDFENIKYFVRSTEKQAASWDDLPDDIKNTYDRLGIPEAEKQRLVSGVAAQYECLAGDTLVWTANRGQIPIKEIAYGDTGFCVRRGGRAVRRSSREGVGADGHSADLRSQDDAAQHSRDGQPPHAGAA